MAKNESINQFNLHAIGILTALAMHGSADTSLAQPCAPVPAGIVSWWQAESNALDSVSSNNGQLMNGTTFGAGEVNLGFNFDGSRNFVLVQSTNANMNIGAGAGFTIEGWINPVSVSRQQLICEYERVLGTYSGSDVGVDFCIQASKQLYANVTDGVTGHEIYAPVNTLTNGVWQHVALTYDKYSGIAALYINGVAVTAQNIGTLTPQTSFPYLLFGARTTFGSVTYPNTLFAGGMDEFSIYNRALYDCEIEAIYNAGSSGKCR